MTILKHLGSAILLATALALVFGGRALPMPWGGFVEAAGALCLFATAWYADRQETKRQP